MYQPFAAKKEAAAAAERATAFAGPASSTGVIAVVYTSDAWCVS